MINGYAFNGTRFSVSEFSKVRDKAVIQIKNPASRDEKWGLCFHFGILKTVFCFLSGDFTEFATINGFDAGGWNAAVVEAFPAQRIVKNRYLIFPFREVRRLFRCKAAQNIHVGIPADDTGLIAKIIEKLFFRLS
jgi:hypothetical protein